MYDKEQYVTYVCGKVETYIEGYAYSSSIPFSELAGIVSEFLRSKASRQLLGTTDNLSPLSNESSRISRQRKERRKTVAKMEIPSSTHRGVWSKKAKAKLSKSMKLAWRKRKTLQRVAKAPLHWTQTERGRAFMSRRSKKMWKEGGTFRNNMQKRQK